GDVVDVAVVVLVLAVAEGDDQVLRGEVSGRADTAGIVDVDAAVAGVVAEVEDAVAVGVVLVLVRAAVHAAHQWLGGRVVRNRQLAAVQVDLEADVVHRSSVVPPDARVEHRDLHVGPACGDGPGGALRRVRVDDRSAADAVVLPRVGVHAVTGLRR